MSLVNGRCLLVVIFLTTGLILRADDKQPEPTVPDGYKLVKLKGGGSIIAPKDENPYQSFSTSSSSSQSNEYHPERIDYTRVSAFSNKQFTAGPAALNKDALANGGQSSFTMKEYTDPNLTKPASISTNTKYTLATPTNFNRSATGFDKTFATSNADMGTDQTSKFATVASYQDKTALMGPSKVSTFTYAESTKNFEGPEADRVNRDLTTMNKGLMALKNLPNRPLTIDEVRDLINHGVKPDTDKPADEESKPLNDPNYKPRPMRDMPITEDNKDNPVPAPGTMAMPEMALPQESSSSDSSSSSETFPLPQPVYQQMPHSTLPAPVSPGYTTP